MNKQRKGQKTRIDSNETLIFEIKFQPDDKSFKLLTLIK